MNKLFLTTTAILMLANTALAEDLFKPTLNGSLEVEVAETEAGDYAASTTISVGLVTQGLTFGEVSVESVDKNTFTIDSWSFGVNTPFVTVSFGDQDSLFVEAYSDYSTIADPEIAESLVISAMGGSLAVGFTDITSDITDISQVQAAYELDAGIVALVTSVDYNVDTEDYAVGIRAKDVEMFNVGLGATISYASSDEVAAYELDTGAFGLTTYINGDSDEAVRNIGAGYVYNLNNLQLAADVNYNIDTEETTPKTSVSFSF